MDSVDCSILEELYNGLKNIDNVNSLLNIVEKEPLRLRDLRNFLVHGKLTREYILVENKVLDHIPFINEPIKLYILSTLLLLSLTNHIKLFKHGMTVCM